MSPFFDRATCNPFKYQLGYIDVIATPLFETWCDFIPDLREMIMVAGIETNRRLITQKIDETKFMDRRLEQSSIDPGNKENSRRGMDVTNIKAADASEILATPGNDVELIHMSSGGRESTVRKGADSSVNS